MENPKGYHSFGRDIGENEVINGEGVPDAKFEKLETLVNDKGESTGLLFHGGTSGSNSSSLKNHSTN